jgi:hypothetical protein
MVKTADDNESRERLMRRGTVNAEKGYCPCSFSTALYRVFILWYEYPMRPLSICMYKGNMRWAYKTDDAAGKCMEIQREGENGHTRMKRCQWQYTVLQGE